MISKYPELNILVISSNKGLVIGDPAYMFKEEFNYDDFLRRTVIDGVSDGFKIVHKRPSSKYNYVVFGGRKLLTPSNCIAVAPIEHITESLSECKYNACVFEGESEAVVAIKDNVLKIHLTQSFKIEME